MLEFSILHLTILYYIVPYHIIPYNTIPYHTIPYYTILYYAILCYTMGALAGYWRGERPRTLLRDGLRKLQDAWIQWIFHELSLSMGLVYFPSRDLKYAPLLCRCLMIVLGFVRIPNDGQKDLWFWSAWAKRGISCTSQRVMHAIQGLHQDPPITL